MEKLSKGRRALNRAGAVSTQFGVSCGISYKLTSLVAQAVKRLPTGRETWVQSLGQEDLLEEGMATHSGILAHPHPTPPPSCGISYRLDFPFCLLMC